MSLPDTVQLVLALLNNEEYRRATICTQMKVNARDVMRRKGERVATLAARHSRAGGAGREPRRAGGTGREPRRGRNVLGWGRSARHEQAMPRRATRTASSTPNRARQRGLRARHADAAPRTRAASAPRRGPRVLGPSRGRARRAGESQGRGPCHGCASRGGRGPGRARRDAGWGGRASQGGAARRASAPGPTASGRATPGQHAERSVPGRAGRARLRATRDARPAGRAPWPSSGHAEPRAIRLRARETREGMDEGGEGGEAHRGTRAERMDATIEVLGDESDGERRKKCCGGEREMNRG
jgi:hypothetical protein